MRKNLIKTSKFLSLVLRHDPGRIGLRLDDEGWASVSELLQCAATTGSPLTEAVLREVVETNDKKRFALSPDGRRIRASQGHSIAVDLGLNPRVPPDTLFHGTATRFVASIRAQGLVAGKRQHVHLSGDYETALQVGQRHGKPVVLSIDAQALHAAGGQFFRSQNGVWLTAAVAPRFIRFP